eukprot:42347_1
MMPIRCFFMFISLVYSWCICTSSSDDSGNSAFKIGTWNSFDIYNSNDRDARRDYVLSHTNELFADLDILCTQEAFTYQSISDMVTNFGDLFPYSYYHNDPSKPSASSTYQACSESEIEYFTSDTSPIYECNNACVDSSLPSTVGYVFCLWRCFGELRDDATGITTRDNNPELFHLGKVLELSPCLVCLWKSKYVNTAMPAAWETDNSTSEEMFADLLDTCSSESNTFDYKPTEGVILWSKHAFDEVEFMPLADATFMPRGAIIGTFTDGSKSDFIEDGQSVSIMCAHLEVTTYNGYFGGSYTTFIQDNIDQKATELSNITQIEIQQLAGKINTLSEKGGNVLLLGDLNIGVHTRIDLYDELLSDAGLRNVFGSTDELSTAVDCSRCDSNPYFDDESQIIDHILIKDGDDSGFEVLNAQRFMDETYDTAEGLLPASDHYGIMAEVQITSPDESVSPSMYHHHVLHLFIYLALQLLMSVPH